MSGEAPLRATPFRVVDWWPTGIPVLSSVECGSVSLGFRFDDPLMIRAAFVVPDQDTAVWFVPRELLSRAVRGSTAGIADIVARPRYIDGVEWLVLSLSGEGEDLSVAVALDVMRDFLREVDAVFPLTDGYYEVTDAKLAAWLEGAV